MTNNEAKNLIEALLNKSGWTVDQNGNCTANE